MAISARTTLVGLAEESANSGTSTKYPTQLRKERSDLHELAVKWGKGLSLGRSDALRQPDIFRYSLPEVRLLVQGVRAAEPSQKLFINTFNSFGACTHTPDHIEHIKILSQGAPLDGIGMQST